MVKDYNKSQDIFTCDIYIKLMMCIGKLLKCMFKKLFCKHEWLRLICNRPFLNNQNSPFVYKWTVLVIKECLQNNFLNMHFNNFLMHIINLSYSSFWLCQAFPANYPVLSSKQHEISSQSNRNM